MTKLTSYRLFLAFLGAMGITMQLMKSGFGMLLYYTVLSNLLVLLFLLYLVYLGLKKPEKLQKTTLLRLKGFVTLGIAITFLVYHFMLAKQAKPEDYWQFKNFIVHYIVPIGFILDTLVIDRAKSYRWFDPLWWTLLPLTYFAFALINGFLFKLPLPGSPDSPFPYWFINVPRYGWATVMSYVLVIAIFYILGGYILFALKSFFRKK